MNIFKVFVAVQMLLLLNVGARISLRFGEQSLLSKKQREALSNAVHDWPSEETLEETNDKLSDNEAQNNDDDGNNLNGLNVGDGLVNMEKITGSDDIAYVLSWLETSDFTTNHMRAQLVDITSGQELCRKDFSYARDSFHPSASSFALIGSDRKLAYCGGTLDARCYLLNTDDDYHHNKKVLTELGPFMYSHASLVTSGGKWLLIGVNEVGTSETLLIDVSNNADFDNLSVEHITDYFGNGNKLGLRQFGGRALVEFPVGSSKTDTGIFYIYWVSPPENTVRVLVSYGDSRSEFTVSRDKIGNPHNIILGPHPACGYATDDQGFVQIYCFASAPIFQTYLLVFSILADNPVNLKSTLENDRITYEASNIADKNIVEGVHVTNFIGAGVTFPLKEKHLSAFIPSGGTKTYVFDAINKTISEYNDVDVPWGASVLFATRAEEQDMANLDCS